MISEPPPMKSLRMMVPSDEPSLFHNCRYPTMKYTPSPDTTMFGVTLLEDGPGPMSFTNAVPSAVPSVFHHSVPKSGLVAVNSREQLTLVRLRGLDDVGPG